MSTRGYTNDILCCSGPKIDVLESFIYGWRKVLNCGKWLWTESMLVTSWDTIIMHETCSYPNSSKGSFFAVLISLCVTI